MYTRRMKLTSDAIVAAGVELVRDEGWPSLSLRAVAGRLRVTPMALYRHVPDGAALTRAVIVAIATGLTTVDRTAEPFADLARWARTARAALQPFAGAGAHLLVVWFELPEVLSTIEDLLEVAEDAGLEGFEAVAAVNAVFMYVLMRSEAEHTVRSAGAVRRALAVGSAERPLPRLRSLAAHYTTAEFDRHFEYGLDALLAGIHSGATR